MLFLTGFLPAEAQDTTNNPISAAGADHQTDYMNNPTAWINESFHNLTDLYLYNSVPEVDTNELFSQLREHVGVVLMLKNRYADDPSSLNIRTVYNMKMRLADILDDIKKWQRKVHAVNEILVRKTQKVVAIKREVNDFNEGADSIFRTNFHSAISDLSRRQQAAEEMVLHALRKNTMIENRIVDINTQVYLFYAQVNLLLQRKEAALLERELPLLWESPPSAYPRSVFEVVRASFVQTMESIRYYGESSLWRIIIFRVVVFFLCMFPIKLFNDEIRKKKIESSISLVYLGKFPKTASLVMGMAAAPFIFVHPPQVFLEFILIGITFTVMLLTFKNFPKLNKPLVFLLILAFLVLYLINFFVTPTFVGRMIYSSSILLLVPIYVLWKQLPQFEIPTYKTVRLLVIFLALHLIAGWILVIYGTYTLARSVILAAYSLLIIGMILKIAIYTLLDYMEILAWFFNRTVKTIRINPDYARRFSGPVLLVLANLFIVVAYLYNLNLADLVFSSVKQFLSATRTIGNTEFTLMSILLFFISIYAAYMAAVLIRRTFEPQHDQTVERRSNVGSYLLLLRLIILITGFTIGIMVSGIPMTNFTIFMGAMGIGIGLGFQNIVSNLISGIIIAFEQPFVVGDVLEFGKESGKVKEISLRATMLSTFEGADILIPNNTLLSENLKNWTISNTCRLLELQIITTHQASVEKVMEILNRCLDNQPDIIRERCFVLFSDITETAFRFTVKIWITDLNIATRIKSRMLTEIQEEFQKNNIAFPQILIQPYDKP